MQQYRILVVDDEEDLCEILQFNLEQAGYIADTAFSAEEVIEKKLYDYDLFLLDIMMGEISGFKLATHLKKIEQCANKPIIFLTAKDTETDKLRGFSVGADDYKVSPVAEFFEGTFLVQFLFQTAEGAFDGFTFFQAHFCCFHCVSPPFDAVAKFIFSFFFRLYSLVKLASSASRARSLVSA